MKRVTNVHYARKVISDELRETLYFCTGIASKKTRTSGFIELQSGPITVKIAGFKSITVNEDRCTSSWEAKFVIGQLAGLDM